LYKRQDGKKIDDQTFLEELALDGRSNNLRELALAKLSNNS
jgi:hypothetical protein